MIIGPTKPIMARMVATTMITAAMEERLVRSFDLSMLSIFLASGRKATAKKIEANTIRMPVKAFMIKRPMRPSPKMTAQKRINVRVSTSIVLLTFLLNYIFNYTTTCVL